MKGAVSNLPIHSSSQRKKKKQSNKKKEANGTNQMLICYKWNENLHTRGGRKYSVVALFPYRVFVFFLLFFVSSLVICCPIFVSTIVTWNEFLWVSHQFWMVAGSHYFELLAAVPKRPVSGATDFAMMMVSVFLIRRLANLVILHFPPPAANKL